MKIKYFLIAFVFTCSFLYSQNSDMSKDIVNGYFRSFQRAIEQEWLQGRSSVLIENNNKTLYEYHNIQDNDLSTTWVEGVDGSGINEWVIIPIDLNGYYFSYSDGNQKKKLNISLKIHNGFCKNDKTYFSNNRIKKGRIDIYEVPILEFEDQRGTQAINSPINISKNEFLFADSSEEQLLDIPIELSGNFINDGHVFLFLKLTILEVYPGEKYDDTCISELHATADVVKEKKPEVANVILSRILPKEKITMNIEKMKEIIYSYEKFKRLKNDSFELILLKNSKFSLLSYSIILGIWKQKKPNEIFMYYIVIKNEKVEKKIGFADPIEKHDLMPAFNLSIFFKQISIFQLLPFYSFHYDFNHDGTDEILSFVQSNITGYIHCIIYVVDINLEGKKAFDICSFPYFSIYPEFINYNCRQGIKVYEYPHDPIDGINDDGYWAFYYYDRVQQKYVRDETASSEELEQIHGSPDFFAEAGIDYTKLERPLIPADLEGFSKPALRIWRNAVYARHGRTFKSEGLQALFNEYVWYKADKNYTDAKLSDTDKANIKLISEFEKK